MKFVFYTNCISPHQLPLAREIVRRLGAENYRYVYTDALADERKTQGWSEAREPWLIRARYGDGTADDLMETCDVLLCGLRDVTLMERRGARTTLYCSERWFKPPTGLWRLLHPGYLRMAWRFTRLLRRRNGVRYLPMGIHAARDMARLCGLFAGDLRCLFRAPALAFDSRPGGGVRRADGGDGRRYCLDALRLWGYFVEPAATLLPVREHTSPHAPIRLLWIGRFLRLKRIDSVIRAVRANHSIQAAPDISLDIYGFGPEEQYLRRLAAGCENFIHFHPPVPIAEVRSLMRTHDICLFSSDAHEGWGAVISEALEEGIRVIGTYEAGAAATLLPASNLYHAGDWKRLAALLRAPVPRVGIGAWTASHAAAVLCSGEGI